MKTTLEITDSLLSRAKVLAAREGTSVRALVEEGLRRVIEERKGRRPFQLRKASFAGKRATAWPNRGQLGRGT